jgi:hypothetical protein
MIAAPPTLLRASSADLGASTATKAWVASADATAGQAPPGSASEGAADPAGLSPMDPDSRLFVNPTYKNNPMQRSYSNSVIRSAVCWEGGVGGC